MSEQIANYVPKWEEPTEHHETADPGQHNQPSLLSHEEASILFCFLRLVALKHLNDDTVVSACVCLLGIYFTNERIACIWLNFVEQIFAKLIHSL